MSEVIHLIKLIKQARGGATLVSPDGMLSAGSRTPHTALQTSSYCSEHGHVRERAWAPYSTLTISALRASVASLLDSSSLSMDEA